MPDSEAGMKYFISVLIAAALLVVGGWLYLNRSRPPAAAGVQQEPAEAASAPQAASPHSQAGTALDREAQAYVRELSELHTKPIPANDADNFVSGRQSLKLLGPAVTEQTTQPDS